VLARIFAMTCDVRTPAGMKEMWAVAKELVPEKDPGRFNESLMELGATVCVPGEPRCGDCPVSDLCEARARGLTAELPVAKKKKPPREIDMVALVARRGARLLLGRRRAAGLFGGLWEPPMVELARGHRPEDSLGSLLGSRIVELEVMGEQTHVLTHRKIRVTITTAGLRSEPSTSGGATYDRFEWRDSSEIGSLGMSSLARKILLACPGRREP